MLIGIFLAYVASTTKLSFSVLISCSVLFFAFSLVSGIMAFHWGGEFVIVSSDAIILQKRNRIIRTIRKEEIKEVALVKSRGFYSNILVIPQCFDSSVFEVHRNEMLRELLGKNDNIIRIVYSNENIKIFKELGYLPTKVVDATNLKVDRCLDI